MQTQPTTNTKLCILFNSGPDIFPLLVEAWKSIKTDDTGQQALILNIYTHLEKVNAGDGILPPHMTIISTGVLPKNEVSTFVKKVKRKVKLFNKNVLPKLLDIELSTLGTTLVIRLKFISGSYVITGNRDENQALAREMNSKMIFDSMRHITLFDFQNFKDLDSVYYLLNTEFIKIKSELMKSIIFKPEVCAKEKGGGWEVYV